MADWHCVRNLLPLLKVRSKTRCTTALFCLAALASFGLYTGKAGFPTVTILHKLWNTESDVPYLDEPKCPGSYSYEERIRMPVTRAVVAHYSEQQSVLYFGQLKWCLRGLLEMMKTEPPKWRTDLILFVENVTMGLMLQNATVGPLLELGCSTEWRRNVSEPFKCVLVPYVKVKDRPVTSNSTDFEKTMKDQLGDFSYGDSVVPLAEFPESYTHYDLVIRTDLDVFFTPAFSTWVPPGCTFVTGNGGYQTDYNIERLARIANHTGHYFNSSIWNIGSTWIGPASVVAEVASKTLHWMIHLSQYEFAPPMRKASWWTKAELWPDWHYGVLSMYAAHLAVNEVTEAGKRLPYQKVELDHPTSSQATCNSTGPIHLHTYHTTEYFSKFLFADNKYGPDDLPRFLNSTSCRDYAGYIAQDSLTITNQELAVMLKKVKDAKREKR